MIATVFQIVLWIWFLGAVVTYRFGKLHLVDGEGFKSMECFALGLYSAGLAAYYLLMPAGRFILAGILVLWAVVQFLCHWRYTLFGVSEQKLKGYNECFRGTLRIFPESETRLVPDLYHIVLHVLILVNLVLCLVY